jgi:single-strand DNA-binding protein
VCGEYLSKGKLCYVEGSIRSGSWQDRDGNKRTSYDIVARFMQMLSPSGNGNGTKPNGTKPTRASEPSEEDNPFRQDEGSEDIPF